MKRALTLLALPAALALTASAAHADSAATASLSFTALAGPGFAWVNTTDNPTSATSAVAAADFAAWVPIPFGEFVPSYGPPGSASSSMDGTAVPISAANSSGTVTYAQAYTFSVLQQSSLQATVMVPVAGQGNATGFARSWFTLAPGASVTFQGSAFLSVSGDMPALPANFISADFYGFASALMASGSQTLVREVGNVLLPYTAGPYAYNDIGLLTLTVSNPGNTPLLSFLDTGVSVYSASPVPEPGAYALLLAGLAVVGFVANRRRG